MAKQIEDTKTAELLPETKRRGRPATGTAMTAAERKRAQRERQAKAVAPGKEETAPMSAILAELGPMVTSGHWKGVERLCAELVKRAKANRT